MNDESLTLIDLFAGTGTLRDREAISEGLPRPPEHECANPWGFSDKFR